MKKIVFALMILLFSTPAWAVVNITAAQVGETNEVIISWEATIDEPNYIRAFGIDVTLSNDANILEVVGLSADYWVHPGTIQIDAQGEITYDGTIAAEYADLPSDTLEGPPDGNGVTLEAGSLYYPVGPGSVNAPALSGDLASLRISKSCLVCLSANVSRAGPDGVVMEDPDQPVTVNYPAECLNFVFEKDECYPEEMADYGEWKAVGEPPSWCYLRQCRGDADNDLEGSPFTGYYYVGINDLTAMINAWKVLEPPNGPGVTIDQLAADFSHSQEGSPFTGYYRVGIADLTILINNWKVLEPPNGPGTPGDCLTP
jgi:hypothetical protein